ncbi:PQ-loop domain-containing transporter [Uliginosibacterium sp. sgz301328]|uniref:PQ-loop domain-containing transporter n=1 Tax=Uliginosibacterium sp. sgz301328 TaxID=3243764 RepID=UPI00359E9979
MSAANLIGWGSACILLATMVRQVITQWRSGSTQGVSRWLFVGQLAASSGFTAYSVATGDVVFVLTNALMVANALIGQCIYVRNRRRAKSSTAAASYSAARP